MIDLLYTSGWGAFTIMLFFQIPFLIIFGNIVYRKAFVNSGPSDAPPKKYSRVEGMWITVAVALFILVNVASINYMPTVITAEAAMVAKNIQEVDVTARSWSYEMSSRKYEVGRPVRFSAKAVDTVHGFGVYHPDGSLLFTMMLMPGLEEPTSIIYTFTEPGKYTVRCLEYCGMAHHAMKDELIVVNSDG
jgi:cytochrome c oxidase subunit 2